MPPLQFNVAQLLLEPMGSTRSFSAGRGRLELSLNTLDVDGAPDSIRMVRTHRGILVQALLDVETPLNCGRCLTDYTWTYPIEIEEEFLPEVDLFTRRGIEIEPDEDVLFHIGGDNVLDLAEAVRQYAIGGQPMKPLCKEDCPGLCHSCGANLNLEPCGCKAEAIDPRWNALASFTSYTSQDDS